MDKTKRGKTNFILLSAFAILFLSMSFSLAAVVINSPVSNYNYSTSILLNVSYTNSSADVISPSSVNTTFYQNEVAITCTGFGANAVSAWCTASTSQLTDGLAQTFSAKVGNQTAFNMTTAGGNATNVGIYTDSPVCAYTYSPETGQIAYLDPIGFVTSDTSTRDSLTTLTHAWTLYDTMLVSKTTSTSASPTIEGSNFDEIGTFTLAQRVTDTFGNVDDCTNLSVAVINRNTGAAVAQEQAASKQSSMIWIVFGIIIAIIILAALALWAIMAFKK